MKTIAQTDSPKIAPQSTLDFDVELVGITAASP